jgi:phosphatidylserine/phosphatidylglycerophosphate/cardiolipin synthase-like enzyme
VGNEEHLARMSIRRPPVARVLVLILSWAGIEAHRAPCHSNHSCPSDRGTYVCGDKGRCDQCPDNAYRLAGKPRMASTASPSLAPPSPAARMPISPGELTVCFTPGGNCTDLIVKALDAAGTSVLVQAYSFTSAPIAKDLVDMQKRGVRVQVILCRLPGQLRRADDDWRCAQHLA